MPGFGIVIATLLVFTSVCGGQQAYNSSLLGIVHGTGKEHCAAGIALHTIVMFTRSLIGLPDETC